MLKKLLEALLFAFISLSASAWEPHGEINLIVAYKAGTATDIGARLLAKHAEKYVGTKINVVNIPGADGKEGWFNLANTTPNGQTIGYINLPTFTTFTVMRDAPFELSDIVPIVNHLSEVSVIVVRADSQYSTIDDLLTALSSDNTIRASTNGYTASNHTAAELFVQSANLEYKPLHCDGTADQLLALRNGTVDFTCAKLSDIISLATNYNSELRILAVFSETRDPSIPDIPTLAEKNLYPQWYGSSRAIAAPKGTPDEVIQFYEEAFGKTLTDPECVREHDKLELNIDYMDSQELTNFIKAQEKFAKKIVSGLYK